MRSSITKRWVQGSLFFTLAVVLVAEGVFLWFTIRGYYDNVRRQMDNTLYTLQGQLSTGSASQRDDEKNQRLVRLVEQFDKKSQFELMLVRSNYTVYTTSSGIVPVYDEPPKDIREALQTGGTGYDVSRSALGEKVMAITMRIPQAARVNSVVGIRLVTSMTLVDRAIQNVVLASVALFAVVVSASVISGVFFIRSIVFPLRKVEATAARIAEGDFATRIFNNSKDEIGSLCKTINHMAEELDKSERMKNEFVSSVSHELRTPLTSIKGWAETVSRLDDPQNPNFAKGMEIIKSETDRLYDMVEELLDFSRIQDGLHLDLELLDLAAECEEAVLLNRQRAIGLGLVLLYEIPELPVPVMADKKRIKQVLVNVLDNAIKYSFTGGEILLEILQDDNNAYVLIHDQGQGIAPEDLENVKLKFYKGKGALRGSGIGLAVVDEIMTAHGGELQLSSEQGKGTHVVLRLPLRKVSENKE